MSEANIDVGNPHTITERAQSEHGPDKVYKYHRKMVFGARDSNGTFHNDVYSRNRDEQGSVIERLKSFASEEISREDFTTINCAILPDITNMCGHLGAAHNIKSVDRVYTGLCKLGRVRCYHEYRVNGNHDVFSDISKLIMTGKTSLSESKRNVANTPTLIFDNHLHTKKFGISIDDYGLIKKLSDNWMVRMSHLNLYHALTGLKHIVDNEPDYILIRDEPIIDDPLRVLSKANRMLNDRRTMLKAWMTI